MAYRQDFLEHTRAPCGCKSILVTRPRQGFSPSPGSKTSQQGSEVEEDSARLTVSTGVQVDLLPNLGVDAANLGSHLDLTESGGQAMACGRLAMDKMTSEIALVSPSERSDDVLTSPFKTAQNSKEEGFAAADEPVLEKAMKRAALRNLESNKQCDAKGEYNFPSVISPCNPPPGYLLNFALASYLGYSPADCFSGYGCSGLTVGEGGHGVFYPGTWLAV